MTSGVVDRGQRRARRWRPRWLGALALCLVAAMPAAAQPHVVAAETAPDTTWGGRVMAAWQRAWSGDWNMASSAFQNLHGERPDAVDPILGLAFVARATGRRDVARRLYSDALVHDSTNAEARASMDQLNWDRPASAEIGSGSTAVSNGAPVSDMSVAASIPVSTMLTVLARGAILSLSDPSAGIPVQAGSSRTTLASLGAVLHPTAAVWLTPRVERWTTAGVGQNFAWVDGAVRVSPWLTMLAGTRALSGEAGSPQIGGGASLGVAAGQTLTIYGSQAIRATAFEARSQVRASWAAAFTSRYSLATAAVHDIDERLTATTWATSLTTMVTPFAGIRTEASVRTGAYARRSLRANLVFRW